MHLSMIVRFGILMLLPSVGGGGGVYTKANPGLFVVNHKNPLSSEGLKDNVVVAISDKFLAGGLLQARGGAICHTDNFGNSIQSSANKFGSNECPLTNGEPQHQKQTSNNNYNNYNDDDNSACYSPSPTASLPLGTIPMAYDNPSRYSRTSVTLSFSSEMGPRPPKPSFTS